MSFRCFLASLLSPLGLPCLALTCWLAGSVTTHGQVNFNVTFDDPEGTFADYFDPLQRSIQAAGDDWLKPFETHDEEVSIEVLVQFRDDLPTATARSIPVVKLGREGNFDLFQEGAAHEVMTGVDSNGEVADALISFGKSYLTNQLWFDPDPVARVEPVPGNRIDAQSIILHEMGHVLSFRGWRNGTTGELPANILSSFDRHVTVGDGSQPLFFEGPNAVEVYGGAVPLTVGNYAHLGNAAPRPGADLVPDLMNGVAFKNGKRFYISDLDVAIALDTGFTRLESTQIDFLMGSSWHVAENWSGGSAPTEDNRAFVEHGGSVDVMEDVQLLALTVGASSTVAISAGEFTTSSSVTLAGSGTELALNETGVLRAESLDVTTEARLALRGGRAQVDQLALGESAALSVRLGPSVSASDTPLIAAGQVELGGQLNLSVEDGFLPSFGDEFVLVESDAEIQGEFASMEVVRPDDARTLALLFDPQQIRAVAALPGDADLSGQVNFADFVIMANRFDQPGDWRDGDFNADGRVQFSDFVVLATNFGRAIELPAAVPEPSAGVLFLLGLLGVHRQRRALSSGRAAGL